MKVVQGARIGRYVHTYLPSHPILSYPSVHCIGRVFILVALLQFQNHHAVPTFSFSTSCRPDPSAAHLKLPSPLSFPSLSFFSPNLTCSCARVFRFCCFYTPFLSWFSRFQNLSGAPVCFLIAKLTPPISPASRTSCLPTAIHRLVPAEVRLNSSHQRQLPII